MFFGNRKRKLAQQKRIRDLEAIAARLQEIVVESSYLGDLPWRFADSDLVSINVKMNEIIQAFPEHKVFLQDLVPKTMYEQEEIYVCKLSLRDGGKVYTHGNCDCKSISHKELKQNKEAFERQFPFGKHNHWYNWDKGTVQMANIHWPWIAYLVNLYQNTIPHYKNKILEKIEEINSEIQNSNFSS